MRAKAQRSSVVSDKIQDTVVRHRRTGEEFEPSPELPKETPLAEEEITCPYCGETFTTLVDCSEDTQDYIEDCQVCCRPIHFHVQSSEGELVSLNVSRE
jgi:hypothetical protein